MVFVLRRLALLPVILLGVSLLVFALFAQLPPGQRAALYVPSVPRTADAIARVIERHGLDDPFVAQYTRWLGNALRGDLGFSATGKEPVAAVVARHLPATAELALWACLPILLPGIWLGRLAANRQDRGVDQALRALSTLTASAPIYLVGLALLMGFGAALGWLPVGGRLSPAASQVVAAPGWSGWTGMHTLDAALRGRWDVALDALAHLVLPVATLALASWAYVLRVTRASMLEALGQDWVRAALARGVSRHAVVHRHAWANARLPVVSLAGLTFVGLLGGVAVVESVFDWPGLGNRFLQAAVSLDAVTTLGLALLAGVTVVVGNLVVDVLAVLLDPRVRGA